MMKSLKFFSFLAMLTAFSNLGADDLSGLPEDGWSTSPSNAKKNGHNSSADRSAKQKNNDPKQRDLFLVDVSGVYLRPYQGGTDFAQIVNVNSNVITGAAFATNANEPFGTNQALDFDFDWGVRGTVGYQNPRNSQTLRATYLYFTSKAHKSIVTGFDPAIRPTTKISVGTHVAGHTTFVSNNGEIGSLFTSADSHWNLHFNMIDVTFGKKYPKRGCMTFEPYIGLKGIILSENQKTSYALPTSGGITTVRSVTGVKAISQAQAFAPAPAPGPGPAIATTTVKLKQKTEFQGVGPTAGLNLNWSFTNWISLLGGVDGALLYSSIETERSSDNALPTIFWIGSSHDIKATPVIEGMIAARGVYCWKSGRYIDLSIGYEGHFIFQTMKHTLLNSDSSTNLSLVGWFATLGFGF